MVLASGGSDNCVNLWLYQIEEKAYKSLNTIEH